MVLRTDLKENFESTGVGQKVPPPAIKICLMRCTLFSLAVDVEKHKKYYIRKINEPETYNL